MSFNPWGKKAATDDAPAPAAAPAAAAPAAPAAGAGGEPAHTGVTLTPAATAAALAATQGQGRTDFLKGCRRTWVSVTRCAGSNAIIASLFTLLPSIYMSVALGITYTGTASYHELFVYSRILGGYLASLSAVVFLSGIIGVCAIAFKWPGVLSIMAWLSEVVAHFFCVLLWIILTATFNVGLPAATYASFIQFSVFGIGPAIVIWSFVGAVMSRHREVLSGIDVV